MQASQGNPLPQPASRHAFSGPPSHKRVTSDTPTQTREEATTTNKNGPPQGPIREICTHSVAHKPLNRENTCPRWDSNCIPGSCKHWEVQETCGIRAGPADARPDPRPNLLTLSTPRMRDLSKHEATAALPIQGARQFRVLRPGVFRTGFPANRILPPRPPAWMGTWLVAVGVQRGDPPVRDVFGSVAQLKSLSTIHPAQVS